MLLWLVASLAIFLLIALWFYTVKQEIAPLREAVQGSAKQAILYRGLLMDIQDDPEKQAYMQEHYDECRRIYACQAKEYQDVIYRPFYAPVAWLLGFRSVPKDIDL